MGLSRFHFAARKLPQTAVTLVCWPLADEVNALPVYNGCEHASKSHSSGRRPCAFSQHVVGPIEARRQIRTLDSGTLDQCYDGGNVTQFDELDVSGLI